MAHKPHFWLKRNPWCQKAIFMSRFAGAFAEQLGSMELAFHTKWQLARPQKVRTDSFEFWTIFPILLTDNYRQSRVVDSPNRTLHWIARYCFIVAHLAQNVKNRGWHLAWIRKECHGAWTYTQAGLIHEIFYEIKVCVLGTDGLCAKCYKRRVV